MSEQSGKTNSTRERPAGQSSEKNSQIGQKQLVWHMDTMIPWDPGSSQCVESLSCLGFGWEGGPIRIPRARSLLPHLHPAHCQAAVISPCPLCASQFPVSCAVKSYPWNRIIVENMVKYFHLTNPCVFSP